MAGSSKNHLMLEPIKSLNEAAAVEALLRGDLMTILPVNFACHSGLVHYYSMANDSPRVMQTLGRM